MSLRNSIALITGGAQGIGKGFAGAILEAGGKVSLIDIETRLGLDTQNEFNKEFGPGSALFIKCDVSKSTELEAAFKQTHDTYRRIDLVVNNAGIATMNPDLWERTLDIDLRAVIHGCFLATRYMTKQSGNSGGHIINMSSAAGLYPAPFDPVYAASKHGVVGLSRSLAIGLQPKHIRVNCLCMSFTDTALVRNASKDPEFADAIKGFPILKISDIITEFKKLIEDSESTGSVVYISPNGAKHFYKPSKL